MSKSKRFSHLTEHTNPSVKSSNSALGSKQLTFPNSLLIIILLLTYPLTFIIPGSWAWENGLIEWLQAAILFCNTVIALWYYYRISDKLWSRFWLAQSPFWLIIFGRETSWGAAFLPFKSLDLHNGPTLIPLRELSYKPFVYPALGTLLLITVFLVAKYKLYKIPLQLMRQKRFPTLTLSIAILAIVAATCFERNFWPSLETKNQMLEEYLETVFYLALSVTNFHIYFLGQSVLWATQIQPKSMNNPTKALRHRTN